MLKTVELLRIFCGLKKLENSQIAFIWNWFFNNLKNFTVSLGRIKNLTDLKVLNFSVYVMKNLIM